MRALRALERWGVCGPAGRAPGLGRGRGVARQAGAALRQDNSDDACAELERVLKFAALLPETSADAKAVSESERSELYMLYQASQLTAGAVTDESTAKLELLKSGQPKEKSLDERKDDLSQSLKGMVKTYEKCERRAKRKDAKAVKRIQRTWRGYRARKETGDVCFKARFVSGFFKTEEVYVSEDEESFEPVSYTHLTLPTKA